MRKSQCGVVSLIPKDLEPLVSAEKKTLLWGKWEERENPAVGKNWTQGSWLELPVFWLLNYDQQAITHPHNPAHILNYVLVSRNHSASVLSWWTVFLTTPNIVLMAHTEWLPTGTFSTTCVVHESGLWWLVVVQGSQFTSQSTGSLSWGSWVQLPMTVSFSLSYPSPLSLHILFLNIFFITSQLQTRPLFFLLINALGTRLILYICYQRKLSC